MLPKSSFLSIIQPSEGSQPRLPAQGSVAGTVQSSQPSSANSGVYTTQIQTPQGPISLQTSQPLETGTQVNLSINSNQANAGAGPSGQSLQVTVSVTSTAASTPAPTATASTLPVPPLVTEGIKYQAQLTNYTSENTLPLKQPTSATITASSQTSSATNATPRIPQSSLGTAGFSQTGQLESANIGPQNSQLTTSPTKAAGAQATSTQSTATQTTQPPNSLPTSSGATANASPTPSSPSALTAQITQTAQIQATNANTGANPAAHSSQSAAQANNTQVAASGVTSPPNQGSSNQSALSQGRLQTAPNTGNTPATNIQGATRHPSNTAPSTQALYSAQALKQAVAQGTSSLAYSQTATTQPQPTLYQANLATGQNINFSSASQFEVNASVLIERTGNQSLTVTSLNQTPPASVKATQATPEAIASALKEALPIQQPLATSLNQVAQLPESTLKSYPALTSLLSLFGVSAHAPSPTTIQQNLLQGGHFTERQLSQGETIPRDNIKALLHQLQGEAAAKPSPFINDLVQRMGSRILQQQLQAALPLVKNERDEALPNDRTLNLDLPIQFQGSFRPVELVLHYGSDEDSENAQVSQWQIRLNIDLEEKGMISADLRLSGDDQVNLTLWCDHPDTFTLANDRLASLSVILGAAGLDCEEVQCHLGTAPERESFKPSVSLVDIKA
ncbi:MAG: flagellar hook-length control protein FliK [Pontibacterium sp.]